MDPFRPTYRELSEAELERIATAKRMAKQLYDHLDGTLVASRERSLAVTKLEEAIMWAVKAYTG